MQNSESDGVYSSAELQPPEETTRRVIYVKAKKSYLPNDRRDRFENALDLSVSIQWAIPLDVW